MLDLHQIATMDRFRLEDLCRQGAQSAFLGGHKSICRMLGRYKFYVDTNDQGFGSNMLLDGFWEMWLTQFMAGYVKRGMVAADIGANYGYYSILLGDLVGPNGRLHSFEPNPLAASFLRESVALNGFSERTTIHNLALGATDGAEAALVVPIAEPKNAYVVSGGVQPDAVPGSAVHTVAIRSLDALLAADVHLDFVKIDAEGAEQEILAGMAGHIARSRPAIVLEFNARRYADPKAFLENILEPYGALHYIDFTGRPAPVAPARVLTENLGEDWLLFLGKP
jgi:FkbM family methyltransferase